MSLQRGTPVHSRGGFLGDSVLKNAVYAAEAGASSAALMSCRLSARPPDPAPCPRVSLCVSECAGGADTPELNRSV